MAISRQFPINVNQRRSVRLGTCVALLGLFAGVAGCGDKLASVSGIVRLDGKPLTAAGVMFHPKDGGPVAGSTTDSNGRYRLESGSQLGVKPGEYCVTVSKYRMSGVGKTGLPLPGQGKIEHLSPAKYNTPATSPLRVTVAQGSQSHDFELTSGTALP